MEERQDVQEMLRPSKKMLGMPVYSVQEGQNLGQVKSLVIDAKEKRLLALVVEKRRLTKEEKLLPFTAVKSVGDDVITVERGHALERRGVDPAVMRALRRPVQPLGARCFTAGGKTMGKVEEYYLDVQNGSIAQLEISEGSLFKGKMLVEGRYIIALAPHTVMLDDEALANCRPQENNLLSSMELARDKAASTARSTVSMLGNSFSKIRGGAKEEALEQAETLETAEAVEVVEATIEEGTEEKEELAETVPAPQMAAEAETVVLAPSVAEMPPQNQARFSPIKVEVLTPDEAQKAADGGKPVHTELPDMLLVQPAEEDTAAGAKIPETTTVAFPAPTDEGPGDTIS